MSSKKLFFIRLLIISLALCGLIYLFHPAAGQFNLIINGQPIAEPLAHFALLPIFLGILVFTGFLMLLSFLGAGLILFILTIGFFLGGLFFMLPFAWPFLAFLFLIYLLILPLDSSDN